MRLLRPYLLVLLAILTASCTPSMLNSGLGRTGVAVVTSTGDPGVYRGVQETRSSETLGRAFDALYQTTVPGAPEDGVGTTHWTYVRGIEFPMARLQDQGFARRLSQPVLNYFNSCPRLLRPGATGEAAASSGVFSSTQTARLILTRFDWTTEVGPGPSQYATSRIVDARIKVFGSSIALLPFRPLKVGVALEYVSADGTRHLAFSRVAGQLRTDQVIADCASKRLDAPSVDLGGTGWFVRNGVFNVSVSIKEE